MNKKAPGKQSLAETVAAVMVRVLVVKLHSSSLPLTFTHVFGAIVPRFAVPSSQTAHLLRFEKADKKHPLFGFGFFCPLYYVLNSNFKYEKSRKKIQPENVLPSTNQHAR